MKLSAQVKLLPSKEQAASLKRTLETANAAAYRRGRKSMARVLAACLLAGWLIVVLMMSASAQPARQLLVLNQAGVPVTERTDGDLVRLAIAAPEAVQATTAISFFLDNEVQPVAGCQIPAGQHACITPPVGALGWYWDANQQIHPERRLRHGLRQ